MVPGGDIPTSPSRSPEPNLFLCLRCGQTWRSMIVLYQPEFSDAWNEKHNRNNVKATCPNCQAPVEMVANATPRRQPLSIEFRIATAVRDADLDSEQLQRLIELLQNATLDTSPRAVAEELPYASGIVVVASRSGRDWIAISLAVLTLVATVWFGLVTELGVDQTAPRPSQPAQVHRTSQLTEHDVDEIARRVISDLQQRRRPRDGHRGDR